MVMGVPLRALVLLMIRKTDSRGRQPPKKPSEKGSEQGFHRRFDQYTNRKMARKAPFQCAVRLLVGASETSRTVSKGILSEIAASRNSRESLAGILVGSKMFKRLLRNH